eukprot:15362156-Ditylum_brightwellii.AAC.1
MYDDPAAMEDYHKRRAMRYVVTEKYPGRPTMVPPRIKYRPSKSPDGEDEGQPCSPQSYPSSTDKMPNSPRKKPSSEKATYDHALLLAEVSAIAHGEAGGDAPPTPAAGDAPDRRDSDRKEGSPQRRRRLDDRAPSNKHILTERMADNKRLCRSPEYNDGPWAANTRSPYPDHVSPSNMQKRPNRSPHSVGGKIDSRYSHSPHVSDGSYQNQRVVGREPPYLDPALQREEGLPYPRERPRVRPSMYHPASQRSGGGGGGPPPPPDFNRYPRGRAPPQEMQYTKSPHSRENEPPHDYYPHVRNTQPPPRAQDYHQPHSQVTNFDKRPRQFMNYDMNSPYLYGPEVGRSGRSASPPPTPMDYEVEMYGQHRRGDYYKSPGAGPSPGGHFFNDRRGSPPSPNMPPHYHHDHYRHQVPSTPVQYSSSPIIPSSDPGGRYYGHPRSPPRQQLRYAPPQSPPRIMYPDDALQHPGPRRDTKQAEKIILRRKFSWKNYPELESFLIANREEYLRHSALNYTIQQKQYNNRLTERLLEVAADNNYVFDEEVFSFVAVRDRIRCYYKSYVQSSKKRGIIVGYKKEKEGILSPKAAAAAAATPDKTDSTDRKGDEKTDDDNDNNKTRNESPEPSTSSSKNDTEDTNPRNPKRMRERATSI